MKCVTNRTLSVRERKVFMRLMTAAAAIALGGCKIVSDPPKQVIVQDVEFLRGCWVAKMAPGGEITGFLRLLPEGPDGLTYQGYLQEISGGEQTTPAHLSFARDGSSMTMRSASGRPISPDDRGGLARPHAPLPEALAAKVPKVAHRVSYAADPARTSWIVAEGDGETLAIHAVTGGGENKSMFKGERDGCD
jgi:hypothetical protein